MRELITELPALDERAAQTIATAMRMVAQADGTHARELALIEDFERELQGEPTGELDLFAVDAPGVREAMLKSLVLVAFADGKVSVDEAKVIHNVAQQVGLSASDVRRAITEVAAALISQLAGAKLFRKDVEQLGREMGLDDDEIQAALDRS